MIRPTALLLFCAILASSQENQQKQNYPRVVYTEEEVKLVAKVRMVRELTDDKRASMTKETALEIRRLPASLNKLRLADSLAFISTEGDPGQDILQEVAITLIEAIRERPPGELDSAYVDLAQLVHYEHVTASLDDRRFAAAMSRLEADDQHRREVDFTLKDLNGKSWTLKDLRGKVVLVIFWATWSRTCRQEMADLERIYQNQKLKKQDDLVILAISSEKREAILSFAKVKNIMRITYPILLDPDQKVAQLFKILVGVPKNFVYDREGKLVAQAIDLRTQKQLLNMLEQAGLR